MGLRKFDCDFKNKCYDDYFEVTLAGTGGGGGGVLIVKLDLVPESIIDCFAIGKTETPCFRF